MGNQGSQPPSGWLQDDKGNKSSMRLMSFISLGVAIVLTAASLSIDNVRQDLVLFFLTGAFAPKAFQKFAEKWEPGSSRNQAPPPQNGGDSA